MSVTGVESGSRSTNASRERERVVEKDETKRTEEKKSADQPKADPQPQANIVPAATQLRSQQDEVAYRASRDLRTRSESSAALQRASLEARLPSTSSRSRSPSTTSTTNTPNENATNENPTNTNATNDNATNENPTNTNAANTNATNTNASNENPTNTNATNDNAANTNATNTNATNTNATNTNATGANAPTSLLTEQVGDGDANCLEQAATGARPGRDNVVFLSDQRTTDQGNANNAGHTLIEDRASGRVWDPRDGQPPQNPKAWTYKNVDDWIARQGTTDGQPNYTVDAKVRAETVQDVLATPAAERAQKISTSGDPGLQRVADRMYADAENPGAQVFLSDNVPPDQRGRFQEIDRWAQNHRGEYRPDEVRNVLAGNSNLGQLTDAERTRVMDHVTHQWRGSSEAYRDPPTNHSAINMLAHQVRNDDALSRFVSQDYAQRAAALTERNAGSGTIPNHRVTAQAASFATHAAFTAARSPENQRALLDSLGDKAPAFTQALQLHDTRLLDGGSFAYGSVPNIEHRAAAANLLMNAAANGAPTPSSTAFVNSAFATMTNETLRMSPDLGKNTARALANHWHPNDPAKRDSEARRFEGILGTDQGRDLLFGKDHTLGSRAENLALMRAHPEWNADTLKSSDNGWENPTIMRERAQPRARDFLANRGDQPVELRGTDLDNTVGFAMRFPPQGIPANETPAQRDAREAAVARGEHSYYRGEPAESATKPVIDQIRAIGGDNPQVTVLPIQYSSRDTGPVELSLFRVRDQATGQDRFVDNTGRRYNSFDDWRNNNQLPPGNMTYPRNGHLTADPAGGVQLDSGNTPKTVDTFGEHVVNVVDKAALVGGVIAGGALLIGTGGTAAPLVLGAASAWGAYRAGESLVDRHQHGQSLNPITDAGARSDWLALGANVFGVAGAGATAAAARFARSGSTLAPAAATAAGYLNVGAAGADAAAALDAGYTLASRWDQLSGGERAQLALSMGFWGVSTARGARQSGARVTDMFNPNAQRNAILANDPILAGTNDPHAQSQRLGQADPALVTDIRARARGLSAEDSARFNADLERALANAPQGSANDVLRLYRNLDPADARRAYDRIQALPTQAARANALGAYGRASAYVDRTITNPADRAAINGTLADVAANPRITGFDDWVRFSTHQRTGASPTEQARNLQDDLGELAIAQNLARNLRPGETVRIGNDANAHTRPNGDTLPSYDIRIEGGANPRNIDVYSPAGRPNVSDLGSAINHAAGKIIDDPTLPANMHTQGAVEGAVRLNWPPGSQRVGAGTIETAPNGDVTLVTGNGRRISQGNFFNDYVATLNDPRRAPAGAARVDQLTVHDRAGNELFRYVRDPRTGVWSGVAP